MIFGHKISNSHLSNHKAVFVSIAYNSIQIGITGKINKNVLILSLIMYFNISLKLGSCGTPIYSTLINERIRKLNFSCIDYAEFNERKPYRHSRINKVLS